jgi:hypothetical protein
MFIFFVLFSYSVCIKSGDYEVNLMISVDKNRVYRAWVCAYAEELWGILSPGNFSISQVSALEGSTCTM